MKDFIRKHLAGLIVIYIVGITLTFGYTNSDAGCYSGYQVGTGFSCDIGNFFSSTVWPMYWVYHTGYILFEPEEER